MYICIHIHYTTIICSFTIWGFDYDFANYNFRKLIEVQSKHRIATPLTRYGSNNQGSA